MAKCLKYGKNTYKPNILFDKIRNNPEFFAKKHGITGTDVEKVLGIGKSNKVDFQIIGEKGAKNLSDAENIMANNKVAKEMEDAGKDSKTIRLATGWEKGGDGKWRYEIGDITEKTNISQDNLEKLFNDKPVSLRELVDDNFGLFNAYKQLGDIQIFITNDKRLGDANGAYFPKSNTILLNKDYVSKNGESTITNTLIHEIQHAIQDVEGFAMGGDPEMFTRDTNLLRKVYPQAFTGGTSDVDIPALKERVNQVRKGLGILYNSSIPEFEKITKEYNLPYDGNPSNDTFTVIEQQLNNLEKTLKEVEDSNNDFSISERELFKIYQRLAGEVESRNVQTRANMSNEERLNTLLQETEDIPRDEQIQIFESSGLQASIPNNEPQKPKNLMPNSLLGKISDELRKESGSEGIMNVVKDSSWYKGLGKSTQENLDFNGVKSLLADSYKYYKENDKFKSENKLSEVRADRDAKLKAQKKSSSERIAKLRESKNAKIERQKEEYTEKVNKIQADYKAKVQKIKESNTSYKAKVAERKILVGETIDELKNVLSGNAISRYITPTEVTRLIKLSGEIALYKNPTKALERFFNVYTEIQYRAFEREQNEGNETITRNEYEELKAFVENFTTLSLDRTSIMTAVRNNDFSFSKNGTLTKEIEKQTDKIIERYEASQNTANGKGKSLNDAYTKSKEDGSEPESFVTRLKNWTKKKITEWTDRQFEVKRLLDKVTGENVYNRLINAGGSSSLAKAKHDKTWDKVFSGLDKEKRELLDKVIVGRRIIAIEENREERGLLPIDHVNGITLEDVTNDFAQYENQYGKEVMAEINKRATEYFKAFDAELDEMYNTGIISEEAYEGMKGIEYQPRVFLEHLKDFAGIVDEEYQGTIYNTGAKSVKREPIKSLKEGGTGDMVMDADWLLKVALSANSRMNAMNEVNKSFMKHELPKARKDFARLQGKSEKDLTAKEKSFIEYFRELNEIFIPNPISGVNRNGKPIYTLSKKPIGYTKNYYFDNGVRNEFFIADRYSEIWNDIYDKPITKAAEKSRVGKWAFLMPSKVTKWVATGNNPLFFFVNTPRDFWHTYNFTKAYSNFLPIGVFQLAKDTFKAYGDKKRYDKGEVGTILEKALNYGIGMDFLYVQGKFDKDFKKDDKSKLGNTLEAINFASSYSELGFRIALFDRVSRNKLAEYNKKNGTNYKSPDEIPNEYERDNIYQSAASSARSVMDFNQGGKVAKDIDGFVPYLNAGIQGTRTMVDAFRKDPKITSLKVAQTALFMTSSVFATAVGLLSLFDDDDEQDATERLLDIYDRITPTQRMNYWNIPIPKSIAEKIDFALPVKSDDKDYYVIRIAKAYSLTPMLYVFEEATLNIMRKMYNRDTAGFGMIASEVTRAVNNNVLPIQLSFDAESPMKTVLNLFGRVPVGKVLMAQEFGWDTYRDGYIDNDINKTVRRAEGLGNENIETFYKEMGKQFGLSPARTKASIEGVITSPTTSPYVSLAYTGMNISANLMSDEQKEIISGRMIDDFKKLATGRIVTKTSSFAESLRRKDAGDSEAVKNAKLEYAEKNDMIQRLAKEFNNGKITEEEIKKTISELDLTNNEKNNMYRNISDRVANKDIDSKLFEVKYNATSAKEKAIKLIELYPNLDLSDNSAESQQLIKEAKQLGGIITADVSEYYGKLKREQSK